MDGVLRPRPLTITMPSEFCWLNMIGSYRFPEFPEIFGPDWGREGMLQTPPLQ